MAGPGAQNFSALGMKVDEIFTLAPRSLRCGVPAISLRPVTAALARLLGVPFRIR